MSTGPAFVSYAEPVFQRALQIVHDSLFSFTKWQQNPESEEPDKTFLIVAIDLLSGLIQGMGALLEPLILQSNPPLLPMLTISLKVSQHGCLSVDTSRPDIFFYHQHPDAAVRQSAYALVGDLAIGIPTLLQPHISELMPELIAQIEAEPRPEFVSASNNAAWSVGEIALHLQDGTYLRFSLVLCATMVLTEFVGYRRQLPELDSELDRAASAHPLEPQEPEELDGELGCHYRSACPRPASHRRPPS